MSHKKLGKLLRGTIVFLAFLGLGCYAVVMPWCLTTFIEQYPEFSGFFAPWLVFVLLTAVPLYSILGFGWSVAGEIGEDRSFTDRNAKSLRGVALCLFVEAGFFFLGNIVYWLLGLNWLGVVIASLFVCLFAAAVGIAVYILAQLVLKAAKIREENEGFI